MDEEQNWYALSLRVSAPYSSAARVTDEIGIVPTSTRDRGALLSPRNPASARAAMSLWVLDSGIERTCPFEDHVAKIANVLQTKLKELTKLAETCEIDLFIGIGVAQANPGVVLTTPVVRLLGEIGIEVIFDLYPREISQTK